MGDNSKHGVKKRIRTRILPFCTEAILNVKAIRFQAPRSTTSTITPFGLKRNFILVCGLAALILLAIWFFFKEPLSLSTSFFSRNGSDYPKGRLRTQAPILVSKDPRVDRLSLGRSLPPSQDSIESFLAHYNRSEDAIAVVFCLTLDNAYLNELRSSARSSIAYFMLALHSTSNVERMQWATKLAQLDPDNGMANMTAARSLASAGHLEKALEFVSKAHDSSRFSNYFGTLADTFSRGSYFFDNNTKLKASTTFSSSAHHFAQEPFREIAIQVKERGIRNHDAVVIFEQLYSSLARMESGTGRIHGTSANFDLARLTILGVANANIEPEYLPASLSRSQLPDDLLVKFAEQRRLDADRMRTLTPDEVDQLVEARLHE